MNNITIILTTTVNVDINNIEYLYQTNPNDRLELYINNINKWLNNTNFNIILVENSGYNFNEINHLKIQYKDRFEVFSFKERELKNTRYLRNLSSKGAHEIFAINYAFYQSKLIHSSNFIIKITGRYFIPTLENYLSKYNLDDYDCLTQNDRDRCEMVGCHYVNFPYMFNIYLIDDDNKYDSHIENIWKLRSSNYDKVLVCNNFHIEKTIRGGFDGYYYFI
jgi:hypothetical protein